MEVKMVKVSVTQKHIDNGCACDNNNCPIALAILSLLKPGFNAYVMYRYMSIGELHDGLIMYPFKQITLPEIASNFISRLDGNELVQPFEFEIELPKEVLC